LEDEFYPSEIEDFTFILESLAKIRKRDEERASREAGGRMRR
jgi:hypothetical protein